MLKAQLLFYSESFNILLFTRSFHLLALSCGPIDFHKIFVSQLNK